MRRIVVLLAFATLPLLARAQATSAPPSPPVPAPAGMLLDSTVHRHLGFALRLDAGIGYMGLLAPSGGSSEGSASGGMGIVIGGAVAEDLILGGDLWGTGMLGRMGMMQNGGTGYGLGGVGLNVTYYIMPANVYLSASPSVTFQSSMVRFGGSTQVSSVAGFGAKLSVGKEWWVGDHWGIGLAGQFFGSWNGTSGNGVGTWTTLAGGVAFSATYN
jgi:hypothetical protein